MKYRDLLEQYAGNDDSLRFSRPQAKALGDFCKWLDSRGPTLRSADQPAIKLLSRIHGYLSDTGSPYDQRLADEIDAVLKAAGGG